MNKRLIDLIHRVDFPARQTRSLPRSVNAALGQAVSLPTDYCDFIETFGAGSFISSHQSRWSVLDLISDGQVALSKDFLEIINHGPYQLGEAILDSYPGGTELLPWGYDDQGETFFWQMVPCESPELWKVVIGKICLFETNVNFSDFLYGSIVDGIDFIGRADVAGVEPWPSPVLFEQSKDA
ncbi:MAG: hypothetical protein KDB01_22375 [Planctomycetaceae bacterium]|nr:hypothetical protein [Planctomycetaceae bacterium]